jgi:hypothetical protein
MSDAHEPEDPAGIRVTSHAEMLYLSAVRLLSERPDAARPEAASAFVVENTPEELFLVCARHSVEGIARTTVHLYTGESLNAVGAPVTYEIHSTDKFWTFHPDGAVDVAVGRFDRIADFFQAQDQPYFVGRIKTADFYQPPPPGKGSFTDKFWHPLPLDEVLIVGYPQDYRDTPTSLPILRRGRIATPLWLDHEGRPVFLVDAAANKGSSGGPVAYVEEEHHFGKTMHDGTGKVVLLGVFSETLPPSALQVTAGKGQPATPPNLGAVYKAHTILEAIRAVV